jgi:AcrR family transcriptional regulator
LSVAGDVTAYPHGRVPRAVRERQLLEIAEQLFGERGYAGTSMDELAKRAGVSKPVVYEIFASKDGLYRACVQANADELAQVVAAAVLPEETPEAKLRAGAIAFFRFAHEHRQSWDVIFCGADGRFAQDAAAIRRRQADLVAGLLRDATVGFGGHQIDAIQMQAAAHALNGASEALANWAADRTDVSPESLADVLVALVVPGLRAMGGI